MRVAFFKPFSATLVWQPMASKVIADLAVYREIPIKFIDVSLEHTVEISNALNIYAYDAYLIQCAQQTSTSLLTLDKGLKAAAEEMGIHVLEVTR